jgi:hypothetical protein
MKPIALDASETRAPVPAAERARWPWAVALAGVAFVALTGVIFLIPTEGPRPAESVRIGRVPDWPEIKNGVPDLVAPSTAGQSDVSDRSIRPAETSPHSLASETQAGASPPDRRVVERTSTQDTFQPPSPPPAAAVALPPTVSARGSAPIQKGDVGPAEASSESPLALQPPATAPPNNANAAFAPAATVPRLRPGADGRSAVPDPAQGSDSVRSGAVVQGAGDLAPSAETLPDHPSGTAAMPETSGPGSATPPTSPSRPGGAAEQRPNAEKGQPDARAKRAVGARKANGSARQASTAPAIRPNSKAPIRTKSANTASHGPSPARSNGKLAAASPPEGTQAGTGVQQTTTPPGERMRVLGIPLPTGREVRDCLLEFRC